MSVGVRSCARRILLLALVLALVISGSETAALSATTPPSTTADPTKAPAPKDRTNETPTDTPSTTTPAPTWQVGPRGTFTDTIPITVPAFHNLKPQLALGYDSSTGDGWTGAGWTLDGLSRIETGSDHKGTPHYDSSDVYYLDGEPLIPCAAGSVSPSCISGGTHSVRTEDYQRIALTGSGTDSRWTVTAKDGTKQVYAPVYVTGTGKVFRWAISQVTDTSGNTITYTWSSAALFGSTWDHPVSITYGGTSIQFDWEAAPDATSEATGAGGLSTDGGRLKTIDVSVGGTRLRAYKLSYGISTDTGRSLLTSVQQFGRDAQLDGSGTVTGGTSLPAVTTAYQTGTQKLVAGTQDQIVNSSGSRYFSMDINGDGKTDMLELAPGPTYQRKTWISNGTGYTLASTGSGDMAYNTASEFITGDFNGDGKSDFVEFFPYGTARGRRLWLSNGTGFTAAATDYIGALDTSRFLAADLNGDGKTDMIEMHSCGGFSVSYCRTAWISNGTGFTAAGTDSAIGLNADRQFLTGDFNGDGRQDMMDIYVAGYQVAQRRVWLSTGTGFVLGSVDTGMSWVQPAANGSGDRYLVMDVNGDSRDDIVELFPSGFGSAYTRRTWLSTGDGFVLASTDTNMTGSSLARQLVGDVNGDGRADMIAINPVFGAPQRQVWLSTGTGFRAAGPTDAGVTTYSCPKDGCTSQFLDADIDGNGTTEMVEIYTTNFGTTRMRRIWNAGGSMPDLMSSRTNEFGGKTAVAYLPSSAWTSDDNPPVKPTATAVTTSDGRGDPATTHFAYAGLHYDWASDRSVGYSYLKQTKPCDPGETACPYTETTYRQDLAAAMKPAREEQHAGDGTLMSSTVYEYSTNGVTVPWTALQTGKWEIAYAGSGADCPGTQCRRKYTTSAYNTYGEVTQLVEYGDYDRTGDERTTSTTYAPNTTAYVVNKPAEVSETQGTTGTGDLLTRTRTSYDAAAWDQPPTAGLATDSARWLSTDGSYVHAGTAYDSAGNLTRQIDEVGAQTQSTYDPTFHIYAVSQTNALNQTAHTDWDTVCGLPSRKTDLNGLDTTYTYDALCRLTEMTGPGAHDVRYSRVAVGDPTSQYLETDRPSADGSGPQWSRSYFDGWQRTWRKADEGPDAQTGDIVVDTGYDARGQVASTTQPYYWVSARPQPTTYTTVTAHDGLDRPTRTSYSDGAHSSKSYGPWTVTSTDENGQVSTDTMNADGKRTASTQTVGGTPATSTYDYDLLKNLLRSTDPQGATITYAVDSLGRTTKMVDPSWGPWTYEWDAAGRMTAQTDAKGQRTTFAYDLLGRKTSRTSVAGTPAADTVTWTYDEPRIGEYNVSKLTTTTDDAGTKTYANDAEGRVVRIVRTIGATAYTYRYGFDAGDRLLWTTYPDGDTLGTPSEPLRYDGAGRLSAIPGYVDSALYTADGKLTRIDNANATITDRPYDAQRGWLDGITTKSVDTTIQDDTFVRNAKGEITGVASSIPQDVRNYTYDENDELTSVTGPAGAGADQTYTYDQAGNITSNSRVGTYQYSASHPDEVTGAGSNAYSYDAAGLMTQDAARTLTWNGDDLLASVTSAGVTTNYTYDADGSRIQETTGSDTTRYLGEDVEVDSAGTYTKYVAIAGTIVARKDGATKHWLHTDQVGTVQAETDDTGAVLDAWGYSPNGALLSGPAPDGSRGFGGHRQDATGLVYMNARYYDPVLGRFISPDPTIDGNGSVGLNRYAYVQNDPVDNTDPTGLCTATSPCRPPGPPRTDAQKWDGVGFAAVRAAISKGVDMLPEISKDIPGVGQILGLGIATYEGYEAYMKNREFTADPANRQNGYQDEPGRIMDNVYKGVGAFLWSELNSLTLNVPASLNSYFQIRDYDEQEQANIDRGLPPGTSLGPRPQTVWPIIGPTDQCHNPPCIG